MNDIYYYTTWLYTSEYIYIRFVRVCFRDHRGRLGARWNLIISIIYDRSKTVNVRLQHTKRKPSAEHNRIPILLYPTSCRLTAKGRAFYTVVYTYIEIINRRPELYALPRIFNNTHFDDIFVVNSAVLLVYTAAAVTRDRLNINAYKVISHGGEKRPISPLFDTDSNHCE